MTNLSYLFAAYAVIWIGLFLYVFSLSRKTRRLEKMLTALKKSKKKKKK
ncbi:MAG TPA: CcmD family protein [Candidatus Aerophobetes bacterium]|uniref:CcmD family protein n=1 Tax=Aerophobetes bacterium TaxID=2030807 RepID=A0A7C1RKD0_UNCAE|nr:CcmD family protein [Candidatus Aerophobetes bacterium]